MFVCNNVFEFEIEFTIDNVIVITIENLPRYLERKL
jgi:hypothetical protein